MTKTPDNFLGLEDEFCDPQRSAFAVLPVPYEGTVSYLPGTANGPSAIIEASQQVELMDEELHFEPCQAGVHTLPAIEPADTPEEQMRRVAKAAGQTLREGKFLLTLGGEHSITAPLVQACAEVHGPISVLQIDAHADLRQQYDGTIHSHAAVMRRVLDSAEAIAQVGIRNFSREEFDDCREYIDRAITPYQIDQDPHWIDEAIGQLGDRVYLTVDIDGLDPSIAPGTGTPEPGGLSWRQTLALLRALCRQRQVLSADIVEVMPIPPSHTTEFLAARLAYKIIAYVQAAATGRL